MTIIIGIKCKDAIVLASDSQTTYGTSKACDATKMSRIHMGNRELLVAQSGSALYSGRAVEILETLAAGKTIMDYRHPAELAWNAMCQLVRELREFRGCSMEELEQYLWRSGDDCGLMLAYYFGGKPYIYTVESMFTPMPFKVDRRFAAIGCGANLGSYILTERVVEELDINLAMILALHVIHTVKENDAFCGGPTKMEWLFSPDVSTPPVVLTTPSEIHSFETFIAERERSAQEQRHGELRDHLEAYLTFRPPGGI